MASSEASSSLDQWRSFFRSSSADIFEMIERAIAVAAADLPDELARRRDRIAEKLYSFRTSRGGELVEIPGGENEAEALADEMEEERWLVEEVFGIKEVLLNQQDESEGVLFDSLRRLQSMQLSVETLEDTEIGRAVSNLKRHKSKKICQLARALIKAWKELVDQWMTDTAVVNDGTTPDSVVLSTFNVNDDEDLLPFPPLDEGALLAATQPAPVELLSKFLDGMDEDGNPHSGRKILVKPTSHPAAPVMINRNLTCSSADPTPEKPSNRSTNSIYPRVPMARPQSDLARHDKLKPSLENKQGSIPKPQHHQQKKPRDDDDASVRAKLEIAKRKLHEGYQHVENAQKQRTIQVMEMKDLPSRASSSSQRRPPQKNQQKSRLRSLLNGRR